MSNRTESYDVFLCHNSADKQEVMLIAIMLKALKLDPWLDDWELQPGKKWQPALEDQILMKSKSVAVFIGKNGLGQWQKWEKDLLLKYRSHIPIIPVLLTDASPDIQNSAIDMAEIFNWTWVDFRFGTKKNTSLNPLFKILWGIRQSKDFSNVNEDYNDVIQDVDLQDLMSIVDRFCDKSEFINKKVFSDLKKIQYKLWGNDDRWLKITQQLSMKALKLHLLQEMISSDHESIEKLIKEKGGEKFKARLMKFDRENDDTFSDLYNNYYSKCSEVWKIKEEDLEQIEEETLDIFLKKIPEVGLIVLKIIHGF